MRLFLRIVLVVLSVLGRHALADERPPNVVVIFCDDLGWGDLGCFGNPTIRTPHLDRMAAEGQKWTQFYVAAPVCTPSRAALMTGRYPIRNGMTSSQRVVLFPDSGGGLPAEEVTLAELLKQKNYAAGIFGKWHLGHLPQYLPTTQGFDTYFGIPYSNDMDKVGGPNYRAAVVDDPDYYPEFSHYNVPLMRDEQIIERPADQNTITRRYTEEAIKFIREKHDRPFFVYLPHSLPHIPLFASPRFRGTSSRGLYGDVIAEIDWSVGQVLDTLRELKLEQHTLVVFSSDNGPWLNFQTHGGSAGPLRAGKGTTFEGGQRVPTIFWWPGTVEPGVVTDLGSTLDLMATFAALTGTQPPDDRRLDSYDLSPVLRGTGLGPRREMYYWTRGELHAVRSGPWKLHVKLREPIDYGRAVILEKPELYHVERDISEAYNVAEQHPEIVERLLAQMKAHEADIEPHDDMLAIPLPK
jgi:arylsulfatase A